MYSLNPTGGINQKTTEMQDNAKSLFCWSLEVYIYIWTYTYHLILTSSQKSKALEEDEKVKEPNNALDADQETQQLLNGEHVAISFPSEKSTEIVENQTRTKQHIRERVVDDKSIEKEW